MASTKPYCRERLPDRCAGSCSDALLFPQALLQEGMQELLKTAADTRAPEPWPCVHALNVLCQAFNDRHLALDISGFCAQGRA